MLKDSLKQFGLTDKQTNLYLSLLELGKANVAELTKKTRLPRSSVYDILETLLERGIAFSFLQKRRITIPYKILTFF